MTTPGCRMIPGWGLGTSTNWLSGTEPSATAWEISNERARLSQATRPLAAVVPGPAAESDARRRRLDKDSIRQGEQHRAYEGAPVAQRFNAHFDLVCLVQSVDCLLNPDQ